MGSFAFTLAGPLGGDDASANFELVTVDHVRIGLSRLCLQFRSAAPMEEPANRTNMEKLLAALLAPFNDLELALQQLLLLRSIYVATGVQLDAIGKLVGQVRGALVDEDYRRFLFARIATNRAIGKRRNQIQIAKLVLNNSAARVVVETQGNATAVIRIENLAVSDGLATILIGFLRLTAAAGVRLELETSPDDLAEQFACPLATFAPGALTSGATTMTVTSTSGFPTHGSLDIDTGLAVAETVTYSAITPTTITCGALASNHTAGAVVQLVEPATGKGFGNLSDPGQPNLVPYTLVGIDGGTLIDVRE